MYVKVLMGLPEIPFSQLQWKLVAAGEQSSALLLLLTPLFVSGVMLLMRVCVCVCTVCRFACARCLA